MNNIYNLFDRAIGLMSRVFANYPVHQGSIPDRVIPKTKKIIVDAPCLALDKEIKGKSGAIQGKSSALPYTSV